VGHSVHISRPYRQHSGHIQFLSLVSGLVIKHHEWDELPLPQSVIDCVSSLAKVSGVSKNLVFPNCNHIPFNWPDNDFPSLYPTSIGVYPDIPAKMPGVLVDLSPTGVSHPVSPPISDFSINDEPDWTIMADEAMQNADLDMAAQLPPSPVVNELDDKDDDHDFGPSHLPSTLCRTLQYIPKVEPNLAPPTISSPLPSHASPVPPPHYPSHIQAPPKHLDEYHLYTTMADKSLNPDPSYPCINAAGHTVDLAIQDEVMIVHVCHYIMMHTVDKLYATPPSTKNNMV
jgi:hypothetical protein